MTEKDDRLRIRNIRDLLQRINTETSSIGDCTLDGLVQKLQNVMRCIGLFKPINPIDTLTESEFEVLKLTAQGYSNEGISNKLFVSYTTVRSHKKNIYPKLGLSRTNDKIRGLEAARLFWEYDPLLLKNIQITPPVEKLTQREYIVLKLLSECCSNEEIGEKLNVSKNTIRKHLKESYRKFGLNNKIYDLRVMSTIIYSIYGEDLIKKPKPYSDTSLEIMQLIAKGYSLKEIARKLNAKYTTMVNLVGMVYSMTGPPKEPWYGRAVEVLKLCMNLQPEFFLNSFTDRELEDYKLIKTLKKDQQNLLEYIVSGYSRKQIAERLSMNRIEVNKLVDTLCGALSIHEESYRSIIIKATRLKMLYDGTVKHPKLKR